MPLQRVRFVKVEIDSFSRQFSKCSSVAGYCLENRITQDLFTIIIEIVIHTDLEEGEQAQAYFSYQPPATLIHDFLDRIHVVIKGIAILQLEGR